MLIKDYVFQLNVQMSHPTIRMKIIECVDNLIEDCVAQFLIPDSASVSDISKEIHLRAILISDVRQKIAIMILSTPETSLLS